ncbi:MAG: undecaprenyl-diphosphate phosphatase [Solirubrobacteraceae bacterium]
MSRDVRRAVALGLLHGPTEALPVSSSGHTALVPWLRGWEWEELDPAARKRFEVALHAGSVLGLALVLRGELGGVYAGGRWLRVVLPAILPAALAGATLQEQIEHRLGKPAQIAGGLLAGGVAMALADRLGGRERSLADAGVLDGLLLGAAQTAALLPGVSRSGAARTVARARGFHPQAAAQLAQAVGLPVTAGAVLWKARELSRADPCELRALAAGAVASGVATAASGLVRTRSLAPYAAYRAAVAGTVLRRLRHNERR